MTEVSSIAELGNLIREKRKSQGLTQAEFAEAAGVGQRIVSEIERGKETAEVGKVLRLARYAGLVIYAGER